MHAACKPGGGALAQRQAAIPRSLSASDGDAGPDSDWRLIRPGARLSDTDGRRRFFLRDAHA